jgi:sigma-B regulation protein RsbU (phosphoserine phosphatase)
MKTEAKKYKRPLRRKILIGCALFCALSCFAAGIFGAVIYSNGMFDRYEAYITGLLHYINDEIDTEDLMTCIETGEESEKFAVLQDTLDSIKENYEIDYVYIVQPLNTNETDNMMNVIAGVTEYELKYEADTLAHLGQLTGDSYSPDVAALYLDAMDLEAGEISFFQNETEYGHDYTGITPVKDPEGNSIAVLAVDISIDDIYSVLINYVVMILVGTAILIVIFLNVIYRWLAKKVIIPISKIQTAAEKFVSDSHNQNDPGLLEYADPHISSEDEIESLSFSLSTLTSDLKNYMKNLVKQTREKERIGTELALATKIQADMLPSIFPPFPDRKEFDIFASMNPAKEVGGDFYDFFMVDENHLAVVMADVSGKGIPAALFMVIGKTLIKDHTEPGVSLGDVFTEVNSVLCASNNEGLFITAFEGVLDITTGEFRYVNAGHEPPFICKVGTDYEKYKVKAGFVLAGMEGMKYKEGVLQLDPGDRIFLFTDGVTEAENNEHELYGDSRLLNILNKTKTMPLDEMLRGIRKDIDAFADGAEQFDDITMLCLEYHGTREDKDISEITVQADIKNQQEVTAFIESRLEEADCPLKTQMNLSVATDEIFSNIAYYAYPDKKGDVTVRLAIKASPAAAEITFIDGGVQFDPLSLPEPDVSLSAEERNIGGLGIFMVKKMMGEVSYEYKDGKNILKIAKNF